MPRTNAEKKDLVVRIRLGPTAAAPLLADAARTGRSISEVASFRLADAITGRSDGRPTTDHGADVEMQPAGAVA